MKFRLLMLALGAVACGAQERIVCKTTADTWIEVPEFNSFRAAAAEKPGHGADAQLVIRGRDALALLQFDVAAAKGMTVTRATLRIHRQPDPVPLHTIGLSTVSGSGPWSENAAGWVFARDGRQYWSYASSDITDVTFGPGGSLYTYPRVRDAGDGWYEADVAPALVHALISGDQFGLMLDDEKGQTQTRHVLSSREGPHPPELIIEGTRADRTAPGKIRALNGGTAIVASTPADAQKLGRTTLRPGNAIVRFGGAGDDAGKGVAAHYELRYSDKPITGAAFASAKPVARYLLDPLAPRTNPMAVSNALSDEVTAVVEGLQPGQVYYFAARASDEAGNAGPVSPLGRYRAWARSYPALPPAAAVESGAATTAAAPKVWAVPELLKINPQTGALLESAEAANHRVRNAVWDAGSATVKLAGARNEFVAFQLAVEGNLAGVNVSVAKPLFAGSKLPAVFEKTGAVQLYREWFVTDGRGWYPDPLIPLEAAFDVPAKDNPVPGQTVQPVFVDVYIPHDAKPGLHTGQLLVAGGGLNQTVTVQVNVDPLTLPDKLNFVVDLNSYSGVESGWGMRRNTPEYRKLEQAYHRMAHLHRTNLDVLGYSQVGPTDPDHAPVLAGEGAATRAVDWSGYDALNGPILDGSAFSDLPRAGVPVPAVYLPFFENWPGKLRTGYKYDYPVIPKTQEEYMQLITKHALEASPVEEAFTQEWQDRFSAAAGEFAAHIRERGWKGTKFYAYYNNKYYFKQPSQGGHGSSWWLLDEPNHRDDVRANSFFTLLLKRGLAKYPDAPISLRGDISRIEWVRDMMPGQIDLDCTSSHLFDKNRFLMDDRDRFGRDFWNYASTNSPRDTNVAMRAWCWRVWMAGGNGIVPWNTTSGGLRAWDRPEPLTVFYVGTKFGKQEPFGCLRLKAYRRGQQDMEYLVLLANRKGWDREAVTRAVSKALNLSGTVKQEFEDDAGTILFKGVKDADLETMRARVARAALEK